MKTENIFKTLAFAMLMPAMMLTTACSSDDSIINTPEKTENTTGKGYEIPITINATREGDDATTRATYINNGDGTGRLEFSEGDKLFVGGSHGDAGDFSGTLNWDGGTVFSGTITTTNPYSGTAIDLLNGSEGCSAILLPAGYTDYNYFTISKVNPDDPNSIESVVRDDSEAFTTSKITAIEQFSGETAYYADNGLFALAPQNAILNFTITGLTPNKYYNEVRFQYPIFGTQGIWINKTVQTDNTGTATFAIGLALRFPLYKNLKNFSLSVDGKDITLVTEDKTLEPGKIYNITRSASGTPTPAAGQFSVSATKKVTFSSGNLQATWDGTSWNWHFAENQWDYIGDATTTPTGNGNTSINGDGTVSASNVTVDLFGWVGASNTTWSGDLGTTGNAAMHGISNSTAINDTNGYGINPSEALKSDWGNTISDGYTWFTLSSDEWQWMLGPSSSPTPGTNCRTSSTVNGTPNARFAKATVVGKSGIIIFPDTYTHPDGVTAPSSINTANAAFTVNSYDATAWGKMETAGCVFLPAAGVRSEASVINAGSRGYYWSSSAHASIADMAYPVNFESGSLYPAGFGQRGYGYSVRLVREVE